MFIDIYFTGNLPVDRDEVEDAFADLGDFEVVGAGGSDVGSHIDLELVSDLPRSEALQAVANVLRGLGLAEISYLKPSDTAERIEVADLYL